MTPTGTDQDQVAVLLGAAAALAAGDWWSRLRHRQVVEYVCKPATLALLLAVALTLDPDSSAMRSWFVAGLACSLAGDILLMLPRDRFAAGLGAFLLGHVAYIAGFWASGWIRGPRLAIGLLVILVAIVPLGVRIVRGARRTQPVLAPPVAAYIAVISVMVVSAVGSGRALAIIGAALFAGSDSLIGWTRFVAPVRGAPVAIMITYHVGQALLVLSLVA